MASDNVVTSLTVLCSSEHRDARKVGACALFWSEGLCVGEMALRQQPGTNKKVIGSIFRRYHDRPYPVWVKEILNGTAVHAATIERLKVTMSGC